MRLKNDTNNFAASFNITPPYQMMVIHSSKLIYPREVYQRRVHRSQVELIAADFNEYIANEPKVSFRNGRYYVVDGQHTIEGRILRNGGKDLPILCKVYLQRQGPQGRSADEVLKHIFSAKGHLQAADVPCYILKITIYRSDDTMVDKFSQVAGNVPVTNNDPNRRYTVINGYPVVLNFAKEPNPGVFERVRDILLATSYTKKTS